MQVERWTWKVKPECYKEAVELLKAERERFQRVPTRIYYGANRPGLFGPKGWISMELEFANDEERKQYWSDWWAEPEAAEFEDKFRPMQESSGSHELWGLA